VSVKRVNGLAVPTPPLAHRYTMDAALLSVHDGDTATLRLRLPFREAYEGRCRFARVNAPELGKPGGKEATDYVIAWFAAVDLLRAKLSAVERDWPLLVQGRNLEKFGRPLLEIWSKGSGANLSDSILAAGHAKPYALTIWQEYRR
jgi:endonuclease YncB( thermonuclease family)